MLATTWTNSEASCPGVTRAWVRYLHAVRASGEAMPVRTRLWLLSNSGNSGGQHLVFRSLQTDGLYSSDVCNVSKPQLPPIKWQRVGVWQSTDRFDP